MNDKPAWTVPADLLPREKQFQDQVVQLAKHCGWLVYHTYDSRWSEPGFPDLLMMRGERIVVAELKAVTGRVSQDQRKWLAAFKRISYIETFLWRPTDWDEVERTLVPTRAELVAGAGNGERGTEVSW